MMCHELRGGRNQRVTKRGGEAMAMATVCRRTRGRRVSDNDTQNEVSGDASVWAASPSMGNGSHAYMATVGGGSGSHAMTRGVREVLLRHARGATSRHATREELARKCQQHRSLPSRPSAIIGGKSRCDIPKILVTSSGDTSDVIWQGREWR